MISKNPTTMNTLNTVRKLVTIQSYYCRCITYNMLLKQDITYNMFIKQDILLLQMHHISNQIQSNFSDHNLISQSISQNDGYSPEGWQKNHNTSCDCIIPKGIPPHVLLKETLDWTRYFDILIDRHKTDGYISKFKTSPVRRPSIFYQLHKDHGKT